MYEGEKAAEKYTRGAIPSTNYAPGGDVEQARPTALMALAENIARSTNRIDMVANRLLDLGIAIHGPRPEPVGEKVGHPQADNFASRIRDLDAAVDRLEAQLAGVIR